MFYNFWGEIQPFVSASGLAKGGILTSALAVNEYDRSRTQNIVMNFFVVSCAQRSTDRPRRSFSDRNLPIVWLLFMLPRL